MSDHGFTPFRRCFNLNTWLLVNGYMRIVTQAGRSRPSSSPTPTGSERGPMRWDQRLYLNVRAGRKGIVEPGAEAERLIRELVGKLEGSSTR